MRSKSFRIFKLLILLIFFSISNVAIAQNPGGRPPIKDLSEIKQMPASADKIIHLVRYARNPSMIYSDELKVEIEEVLQWAKDQKIDDQIANLTATRAIIELGLGNQELAVSYIKQAEEFLPKINDFQAVSIVSDLTRIYSRISNFEKAILYFDKMEALTKDKPQFILPRIAHLKNRINIDIRTGNTAKLKANYNIILKLAKESNNPDLLKNTRFSYAHALLNIRKEDEAFEILKELIPDLDNSTNNQTAQFFNILSRNYEANGDYKNALIYAEKEFNLPIATTQQKGNSVNKMILLSYLLKNYNNLDKYIVEHRKFGMDENNLFSRKQYFLAESRYYHVKGKTNLAKRNYKKVLNLKMGKQLAPTLDIAALTGLASLYAKENKNDSASLYFKKAENSLKKYPVNPATRLIYANSLKEFNQTNKISQDTLIKNLEQEMHLKDTLYQMSLSKITHELATKYRVSEKEKALVIAKKQQQLQQLEIKQQRQRNWLIIMGATVALLLLTALAYILFQRKKQATLLHNATVNDLRKQHRIDIMDTLTEAQEQEKKRVAERLHDEVGAMISIANLNINSLQKDIFSTNVDAENKLKVTQKLMSDISETVRNISHTLMPIALEKYGFKAAILDLLTAIKTANRLSVEHVIEGLDHTENWPQNFTLSTYRIIQEIVNNAIKHAEASHLFVQLIELDNALTIYIEDNGKGIEQDHDESGAGMKLLETNIAYLSGKLEIKGEPNQGTFALIELPIPNIVEL
ncbi:hypothetical protein FA048_12540 [Pedobacter polaris]|uniref:histidine kinase n=1 Tax=Pedobacter polaris TaxID=2571273 RepID=A0A4U1CL67_9SPHI|nr:ATP-binding protein [Pedobacter polaris]TKC07987.1 hypothetical protein FA048_12540 [Pedobacter polaris]